MFAQAAIFEIHAVETGYVVVSPCTLVAVADMPVPAPCLAGTSRSMRLRA